MWYAGYGLCSQRKDKGHDAHIKSWTSANENKGIKTAVVGIAIPRINNFCIIDILIDLW